MSIILDNVEKERVAMLKLFRAEYFNPNTKTVVTAPDQDLYYYEAFVGPHAVDVAKGDCVFYVDEDMGKAFQVPGPATIHSRHLATVIRGYMPEHRVAGIDKWASLPYVNGCSTHQVFPPVRAGDPTLQILDMPPHSSEQAHHVHSTARVVLVLSGKGRSVVGMHDKKVSEDLYRGKVVLLHKFSPHHFETDAEWLRVLPLHVFSSVGSQEAVHPMFNGTHMTG